jgi:hypothetical protein
MISMRAVPIAAIITTVGLASLGLTPSASAQMFGPGMGFPGAAPGMGFPGAAPPPQRPQEPPCFKEFAPLRAEAEKRANAIKVGMEKKLPREEICSLLKSFSAAEAKVVKFIVANSQSCGIPPEAGTQMKANHTRTIRSQKQVCDGGGVAGAQKPTGPGLSEALGTNRPLAGNDPGAPQSGTLNTLSGNVLSRCVKRAAASPTRPATGSIRSHPPGSAPICGSPAPIVRSARGCC